jgi:hypothetical protein
VDRIKKAINDHLKAKVTGWAMAIYYAGMR